MRDVRIRDDKDVLDARTSERLSTRLRQARQLRGMTLKVLADATGCSESLLSKIENGKAYPSLPMLTRLVQSLDMSMGWIFDNRDGKEPLIFRAGGRPEAATGVGPVTIERVIPEIESQRLQCWICHVEAGASSDSHHQHAGEEVGYVMDGQVELVVDGRPHPLGAGDAFAFRADQPHSYRNVGPKRASIFAVTTPSA